MSQEIIIYTDGACSGNPGPGGWAAILQYQDGGNEKSQEITGGEIETTNNRMELTAAIKALDKLNEIAANDTTPMPVNLYTDSKYVQDGITSWVEKWKINNWMTSNRTPVKNKDLWELLSQLQERHRVNWYWVKAHDGNVMNERVDALARNAVVATIMQHPEY